MAKIDYSKVTAKDINQMFILEYCQATGNVAWLKEQRNKKVTMYRYPTVEVNGKKRKDKEAEPIAYETTMNTPMLKKAFIEKFFPHLVKQKKLSFWDMVDAL